MPSQHIALHRAQDGAPLSSDPVRLVNPVFHPEMDGALSLRIDEDPNQEGVLFFEVFDPKLVGIFQDDDRNPLHVASTKTKREVLIGRQIGSDGRLFVLEEPGFAQRLSSLTNHVVTQYVGWVKPDGSWVSQEDIQSLQDVPHQWASNSGIVRCLADLPSWLGVSEHNGSPRWSPRSSAASDSHDSHYSDQDREPISHIVCLTPIHRDHACTHQANTELLRRLFHNTYAPGGLFDLDLGALIEQIGVDEAHPLQDDRVPWDFGFSQGTTFEGGVSLDTALGEDASQCLRVTGPGARQGSAQKVAAPVAWAYQALKVRPKHALSFDVPSSGLRHAKSPIQGSR